MELPTEVQIERLLQALDQITGNDDAARFAAAAGENLRRLIGTGVFEPSLTGQLLALMQVIADDSKLKEPDRVIARALLTAFEPDFGCARLSKPQLSARTGFSTSKVRMSLRRLIQAGYFLAMRPTAREWDEGDFTVRHRPRFEMIG